MAMLVYILALNNNPDGEYANSGNPMGSMSDGAYYNAENQSVGIKVTTIFFFTCVHFKDLYHRRSQYHIPS